METTRFVRLVAKQTSGKLWARGAIWETPDEKNKLIFLCGECSIKEFKKLQQSVLSEQEAEKLFEKASSDAIEPLPKIPEKYKGELYASETDWHYRMVNNAVIKCEGCGEIVT